MSRYEVYAPIYFDIPNGKTEKLSLVSKFGRNENVGTSYVPVSIGGIYRTPQVSGATQLRVKAGGDAADAAGGNGAREVTIVGLDATGALIEEVIATNGISASSNTTNSFLRVFRAFVSSSGTYATASAGSHAAAITIENSAGTEDWFTIDATGFPKGQSEIGAYTVPLGYRAFIKNVNIVVDSAKTADVILFKRENILETAAPYTAMRAQSSLKGVTGEAPVVRDIPDGPYNALTDFGFMAKLDTGTGEVSVDFDIILEEYGG